MPHLRYLIIDAIKEESGLPETASLPEHCRALTQKVLMEWELGAARRKGIAEPCRCGEGGHWQTREGDGIRGGNLFTIATVERGDFEHITERRHLPQELAAEVRAMMRGTLHTAADVLVVCAAMPWHINVEREPVLYRVRQTTHVVKEA